MAKFFASSLDLNEKTMFHIITLHEWHTCMHKMQIKKKRQGNGWEKRLDACNMRIPYGDIPDCRLYWNHFSPQFYCYIFMGQTGITGRRPILTLTSSFTYVPSIFWLFPLWAGGLLSEFTGPSCLYCRYCALAISDLVAVQHCLLAADPRPPSAGHVASRAPLFSVLTKTNRGRDIFLCVLMTRETGFPARPPETKWFPALAPTKDKAQDPHRCLPGVRGPSSVSL